MAVHYPEKMRLRLPRGMPDALALAAAQHHTTPSEWVRQALLRGLQADGVCIREGTAAVSDRGNAAAGADLREAGQQGGFLGDPRSN
jgi:hypothetical protein